MPPKKQTKKKTTNGRAGRPRTRSRSRPRLHDDDDDDEQAEDDGAPAYTTRDRSRRDGSRTRPRPPVDPYRQTYSQADHDKMKQKVRERSLSRSRAKGTPAATLKKKPAPTTKRAGSRRPERERSLSRSRAKGTQKKPTLKKKPVPRYESEESEESEDSDSEKKPAAKPTLKKKPVPRYESEESEESGNENENRGAQSYQSNRGGNANMQTSVSYERLEEALVVSQRENACLQGKWDAEVDVWKKNCAVVIEFEALVQQLRRDRARDMREAAANEENLRFIISALAAVLLACFAYIFFLFKK